MYIFTIVVTHYSIKHQRVYLHIYTQLSVNGLPVVLTDTPFDNWTAATWTPSLLARTVKLIPCKKSPERVFKYFAVGKPLEPFSFPKPFQEVVYPGKKFFELLQEPFDGSYYYSSGGIELLGLEDTFTDDSLPLLTFPAHGSYGQINFWFGGANVTAYTHYDTSHNLHLVVYGRKKFVIFPPSSHAELILYPSLHQFYRQVQRDVLSPEVIPELTSSPLEVILSPGEVLYLPPYWFHCVISLETTISLNVWSNSEVFLVMEDIFAAPIPFEEEWGKLKLLQAFNYFAKMLVLEVVSDKSFVDRLLYSRYDALLARLPESLQLQLSVSAKQHCASNLEAILDLASIEHIQEVVLRTTEKFQKIRPIAIREINLGNYIEQVAWRILGNRQIMLLPFFLKECF